MSTLQRQVIQSLDGLSDDNLNFLLDMIQRFMKPVETKDENTRNVTVGRCRRTIGSLEGMDLIATGYDIDECNSEIAEMFEVSGQ